MSEPLDLDAIRERAEAATEGPWHAEHDDPAWDYCVRQGDYGWVTPAMGPEYDRDTDQGRADAEFIAHARADVPALLARITELEAEVAQRDQARAELAEERRKVEVLMLGDQALSSRIWLNEEVARLRAELERLRAAPTPQDTALVAAAVRFATTSAVSTDEAMKMLTEAMGIRELRAEVEMLRTRVGVESLSADRAKP